MTCLDDAAAGDLNAIPITEAELRRLVAVHDVYRREHPGSAGSGIEKLLLATRVVDGDTRKALALWSRLRALCSLFAEDAAGWSAVLAGNQAASTVRVLFEVAASHPLVEGPGRWDFERESFFARVLLLSRPATCA